MSMTENEAKSCIQGKLDCMNKCDVFDCKNTDECDSCGFCYSQGNFGEQKKAFDMAIQALEEVQAYRTIGTIERFRELTEKAEPKKPYEHNFYEESHYYLCPECRNILSSNQNFCEECGTAIDWE
jgi:hypothetical protein